MAQFEIIYDSSKEESLQFYNTSIKQFISPNEAQSLSNQGLGKIVIGRAPASTSCSVILHDQSSPYWECYYNTDTDKFLCEADANTLQQIGLGRIVAGKIPYVITKENGIYFDVVKDRRIGEQTALQIVSSGVAVLKNKGRSNESRDESRDEFVDASTNLLPDTNPGDSTNSGTSPNSSTRPNSLPPRSISSQPGRSLVSTTCSQPSLKQEVGTFSSSGPSSSVQSEKEESWVDIVAPIAAGAAIAGVAIAGVAAAMFFGSGGGKNKKKK
ncbi:uncharacterized protein LOC134812209 [Bolinopsis microptera]|uniref:uncharacterized protein LOC134812209 n=1 Tax=Bolinopsis microptera TaxID=2820187 RepID=UPI00307A1338